MSKDLAQAIAFALTSQLARQERARLIAEAIRSFRNYRWVGIYDVGAESVSIIAYSGPSAPAYPQFPVNSGLTGSAISEKKPIVVGDVRKDSRYLTAFGSTLSEMIVPVLDERTGAVVGTLDVESETANAFSGEDQRMLEQCAVAARPLWAGM